MKFKKLYIKNFFSFGDKEVTFDFDDCEGITLVSGANGNGKSSFFASLIWVLYGNSRQETADDVVNRITKKNCKVRLDFQINEDNFSVIRYRKHETHNNAIYVFKNDKDISSKNASDTNHLIEDLIKIPYVGFINSTFFSNETYKRFLKAKMSERLVIFENILSLKEANLIYDKARSKFSINEDLLKEKDTEKRIGEQKIETLEEINSNYSNEAKKKILSMKEKKETLKEELLKLIEKKEEFSSIDREKEKENIKLWESDSLINAEIKKLEKDFRLYPAPPSPKILSLASMEYNPTEDLKLFKELEILGIDLEQGKDNLNIEMTEIGLLEKEIKHLIEAKSKREEELKDSIKELEMIECSICPYCFQAIDKEKTEQEKKRLEFFIGSLKDELNNSQSKIDNLNDDLSSKEKNKSDYWNISKALEEKMKEMRKLIKQENPNDYFNSIQNAKKELENYLNVKSGLEDFDSHLKKQINDLKEKLGGNSKPKYDLKYLESIDSIIESYDKRTLEIEKEIDLLVSSVSGVYDKTFIESNNKVIEEYKEKLEITKAEIKELKEKNKYLEIIMESFSNKSSGFKKYFIGEMIESFNEKINQFLPFLFEDRDLKITFDKNLNEEIISNDEKISFSSLSTGQQARADLAISFSLFYLSRVFFKNDSNVFVVDEMLDLGLDSAGIKNAVTILEGFDSEIKIFLISHNPEIKEEIKNVIEIKKDRNDFSYIV